MTDAAIKVSFDPPKREATIVEKGLDFEDAAVFAGRTIDLSNSRFDYGETRIMTFGFYAIDLLSSAGRYVARRVDEESQ